MKTNWQIKKLGEVLDYEQPTKYIVKSNNYSDSYKTPVLTAGRSFVRGYTDEKINIFPADKLPVIIFDDFTTATQFVNFQFKVKSSAMKILHAKKEAADIRYLFYVIQTLEHDHITHKRYWISEYSNIEIPLPPLDEQKRIVKILDEKIGKIKEAIKLREEAIADTEKILSRTLSETFTEGKKKGWGEVSLGEEDYIKIIDGDRGKNYPTKNQFTSDGHCLFLNTSNVRKGIFDFSRMDFITKEKDLSLRKGKLTRGDVVLTTRGTLGNSAYFDKSILYENMRINSGMVILRVNNTRLLPEYLIYIINSIEFIKKINDANSGSAQPQLPIKVLSKLSFPVPSLTEQKQIIQKLDLLSEKIKQLKELQTSQLSDLKRLEKSLLREAFNGEL